MRSLSIRLVLAFLLTSVVGVGLAALFIQQLVVDGFDDFLLEQRRDDFVEATQSYYSEYGTWQGVNEWLRDNGAPKHSEEGGDFPPPDLDQPPPFPNRIFFSLADSNGMLVVSPDPRQRGQQVSASELAKGMAISINGEQVGTVLLLGQAPQRNPAEERYLARTSWALAAAAAIALGIALVLGILLAQFITRPVRSLTKAAAAIAEGDLYQQVPVHSDDELGQLALQFNRMSKDLAQATAARRRMTADIAHDLRTPLTVIAGYLEALRDEVLTPTPKRFGMMYDETQHLLHMVEDLHTLSLADAGTLALNPAPIKPLALLEQVADIFQHSAQQQQIALQVESDSDLPELQIDHNQMVRTLSNLLSNALRYTPDGGRITLGAHQDADQLVLEVADTGSGIDENELQNIFERFYRTDTSRTLETGGSGLGLAIVRSIVEAHGGTVSASSRLGHGTTFSIRLPMKA
jgi:signal transduction histidine kinase